MRILLNINWFISLLILKPYVQTRLISQVCIPQQEFPLIIALQPDTIP